MPDTDLSKADYGDVRNKITDYSVLAQDTEAAGDQQEFTWQCTNWSTYLGYYKSIPELQTAIDAKAIWTMGAGFESDATTELLLMTIRGNGKDSFNTILTNLIRTYTIAGDSYAEIIRNKDGLLVNLKPLDPGSIVIVQNQKGQIKRYEQTSKVSKDIKKFQPKDMLHLSRKRVADEIHGISVIPAVEWIILARNEAMTDWKRVCHRNIDPLWIFHLDTDDTSKISDFKSKMDAARVNGENMYVPKGAVVPELVTVSQNGNLNPLTWINQLNDYFFQCVNVPQIIIGNAKEFTDASGKIVYLSYEQSVKSEQLYIEEQILNQLNIEIQLTFPASLQNDVISDNSKAPDMIAAQPADTQMKKGGL
jgi:hypothetical protein